MGFQATTLDDDPVLLEQSYRLRFQVYCVERRFLPVEDYPDQLERDAFDEDAIHVGVLDELRELAATARVILPNPAGLPLFQHCTLFPDETLLDETANLVVEVSRVSISRRYSRRQQDPERGEPVVTPPSATVPVPIERERRRHNAEPFLSLLRAIHLGVKIARATHVIGATDLALHRWLVHYGFPYRLAGPEVEYYGRVAPYIMSMAELDQMILGRKFPALEGFAVGLEPSLAEAR